MMVSAAESGRGVNGLITMRPSSLTIATLSLVLLSMSVAHAALAQEANATDPAWKAVEPPADLKEILKKRPSGVRLGVALVVPIMTTLGKSHGMTGVSPAAFPYISWHPARGVVTDAYCAARRNGDEYAQRVADDFARRLHKAGQATDWVEGKNGACHSWGKNVWGVYIGLAVPFSTTVPDGDRKTLREVMMTTSGGLSLQPWDYVSIMVGPVFSLIAIEREDETKYRKAAFGGMVGVGGSFDLGGLFFP